MLFRSATTRTLSRSGSWSSSVTDVAVSPPRGRARCRRRRGRPPRWRRCDRTSGSASALAPVNALVPDFKLPSQWRASFSGDWQPEFLGSGWTFGADVLYSKVREQVYFADARVFPTALRTPDGRIRYKQISAITPQDMQQKILPLAAQLAR